LLTKLLIEALGGEGEPEPEVIGDDDLPLDENIMLDACARGWIEGE
jgi:hypothetical protein